MLEKHALMILGKRMSALPRSPAAAAAAVHIEGSSKRATIAHSSSGRCANVLPVIKAGMHSLRALAGELQNGRPAPTGLEVAPSSPSATPGPSGLTPGDTALLHDRLYGAMRDHVHAMDRGMGRIPDEASDRVAAALCAECRANGLTRIDGVVLGQKGSRAEPGEYVFAYSGPADRPHDWVGVKTAEAVQTPVEQSLAKAASLECGRTEPTPSVDRPCRAADEASVRSL